VATVIRSTYRELLADLKSDDKANNERTMSEQRHDDDIGWSIRAIGIDRFGGFEIDLPSAFRSFFIAPGARKSVDIHRTLETRSKYKCRIG